MLGTDESVPERFLRSGQTRPSPLPEDPDQQIAAKLLAGGDRALAPLQRYAAAAERSYYKAHAEFMKSRKLRNEAKAFVEYAGMMARAGAGIPARVRNEPKFYTAPGENLALRL